MGLISTKLAFLEQLLRGTEYITYKVMTMETISKGAHLNHCCSGYSQHFQSQKGFKRKGKINELSGDMILHLPSQWVHAKN
jgi:hypothetical protein